MIILCSIVTALALAGGFYFGFKLGRDGELPSIRKHKEEVKERKIEAEKEEKATKFEKALANLDRYDGTDRGQEEIE